MSRDTELLRAYATTRSEEAFGQFVRRHLTFVYTTALRRVAGDTHRAEEIAQHVFTRAAQKSAALARHPAINAWLHTATRYASADLVRREQRRRSREKPTPPTAPKKTPPAAPPKNSSAANSLRSPSRLRPIPTAALSVAWPNHRSPPPPR